MKIDFRKIGQYILDSAKRSAARVSKHNVYTRIGKWMVGVAMMTAIALPVLCAVAHFYERAKTQRRHNA